MPPFLVGGLVSLLFAVIAISAFEIGAHRGTSVLDRKVQDYNAALQRARDADANADAAMRMQKSSSDLAIQEALTAGHTAKSDEASRNSEAETDKLLQYDQERFQALQSAIALLATMKSDPGFQQGYVEGELCLTHERLPGNLPQAENLHFMRRR